jgi:hypothetical protein
MEKAGGSKREFIRQITLNMLVQVCPIKSQKKIVPLFDLSRPAFPFIASPFMPPALASCLPAIPHPHSFFNLK